MMVFLFGVSMLTVGWTREGSNHLLKAYVLSSDSSKDGLALINGTGSRMIATSPFL